MAPATAGEPAGGRGPDRPAAWRTPWGGTRGGD